MKGEIITILSDLYKVMDENGNIHSCKCRGLFRKNKISPLVGDRCIFDENDIIRDIEKRRNEIKRPPVANIDQAFVLTSVKHPNLEPMLLDKLLVELELNNIIPIIVISKYDLLKDNEKESIDSFFRYYESIGYTVVKNTEYDKIKSLIKNKTTVFTGQTGSGKSTLLNNLDSSLNLETNEISYSLGRGKHTTRNTSLISIFEGKVLDTPGFSALEFKHDEKDKIKDAFIEFSNYPCMYRDCSHTDEVECKVKEAVRENKIMKSRYENFIKIRSEIKDKRW